MLLSEFPSSLPAKGPGSPSCSPTGSRSIPSGTFFFSFIPAFFSPPSYQIVFRSAVSPSPLRALIGFMFAHYPPICSYFRRPSRRNHSSLLSYTLSFFFSPLLRAQKLPLQVPLLFSKFSFYFVFLCWAPPFSPRSFSIGRMVLLTVTVLFLLGSNTGSSPFFSDQNDASPLFFPPWSLTFSPPKISFFLLHGLPLFAKFFHPPLFCGVSQFHVPVLLYCRYA